MDNIQDVKKTNQELELKKQEIAKIHREFNKKIEEIYFDFLKKVEKIKERQIPISKGNDSKPE